MSLFSLITGLEGPLRVVILQTKTGETFRGLLVTRNRSVTVLRSARVGMVSPTEGEKWTPLQGDTVIPSDNVDYWQEGLPAALLLD